jgi:hypothetical protein
MNNTKLYLATKLSVEFEDIMSYDTGMKSDSLSPKERKRFCHPIVT